MLYVGIDTAKEIHEASLINEQDKLQGRSIRFSNILVDFHRFLQWLPKDTLEMANGSHRTLLVYPL